MPSLKNVKNKITGIRKTKQITKAMGMVASAKLRGAQTQIEQFLHYAEKFQDVIYDLATQKDETSHILLESRKKPASATIILITSDRGLCGAFNILLITKAIKLAEQKTSEGLSVNFICIGKKGYDAIKKSDYTLNPDYNNTTDKNFILASQICKNVLYQYTNYTTDEVYIIYSQFFSIAKQTAVSSMLLPIRQTDFNNHAQKTIQETVYKEYIYEPSPSILLAKLLPQFITVQIYRGFLDTTASEHAARMSAMDNATRNSDEIVGKLTRLFNKTRQASITSELIDIVSGAEALK